MSHHWKGVGGRNLFGKCVKSGNRSQVLFAVTSGNHFRGEQVCKRQTSRSDRDLSFIGSVDEGNEPKRICLVNELVRATEADTVDPLY
jgi:hypothetical protein